MNPEVPSFVPTGYLSLHIPYPLDKTYFPLDQPYYPLDQPYYPLDQPYYPLDQPYYPLDQPFKTLDQSFQTLDQTYPLIQPFYHSLEPCYHLLSSNYSVAYPAVAYQPITTTPSNSWNYYQPIGHSITEIYQHFEDPKENWTPIWSDTFKDATLIHDKIEENRLAFEHKSKMMENLQICVSRKLLHPQPQKMLSQIDIDTIEEQARGYSI